jgi:DNA polymerase-3 subunit epsilon
MSLLDTPVNEAAWTALDFESTGAMAGQTDEPVQVGMARWRERDGAPADFFRSMIRPDRAVSRSARAVHGLGDEELREAPAMLSLWPEFKARLQGSVVVAHGAGTEKRFLRAFPMHGFGPWLDTLHIARAVVPEWPDHALGSVIKALGLEAEVRELCPALTWHDALFDAVACLVFLRRVIGDLGLSGLRVGQLMNFDASAYHARRNMLRWARSAGWSGQG